MSIENKSFIEITMVDITKWCRENNQVKWLAEAYKEKEFPVYPTIEVTTKKGNKSVRQNKNAAPIGKETRKPTHAEVKAMWIKDFGEKKTSKAPSADDLVNALISGDMALYEKLEKQYKEAAAAQKAKKAEKNSAE